jgi:CBS domain-containing protein
MTIARILTAKGREVCTAQPHRTLAEAAVILTGHKIGAVVIVDGQGAVIGMLSERDIVRAISESGAAALKDTISMHMSAKVITTTENECVHSAMEKMTNQRFRHLPVISQDRLVGLVSIGDVVKYRLAEMEHEHQAMREYIATA